MKLLYIIGRIILYTALGITMLFGAIIMAAFRGTR